jgi:hypothetical protein
VEVEEGDGEDDGERLALVVGEIVLEMFVGANEINEMVVSAADVVVVVVRGDVVVGSHFAILRRAKATSDRAACRAVEAVGLAGGCILQSARGQVAEGQVWRGADEIVPNDIEPSQQRETAQVRRQRREIAVADEKLAKCRRHCRQWAVESGWRLCAIG